MAYIGNNLQVAFPSYRIIDDISGSFNGSLKTFALKVSGAAPVPFPINPQQCLISVNGVVQKPDPTGASGFNLSGTNIVFATAPTGGWAFFGIILAGADYVNVGANFPSGTAAAPSITFDSNTTTGVYLASSNVLGFATGGTQRITIDSNGNFNLSGSGSAASPAIKFGAGTAGIYSPGTDQVAISTNGTGRLFVDSNGNVGIATSTPNTAGYGGSVLGILGSGNNGGNIWLTSETTASGNRTGRIGFGTEGNTVNKETARIWSTADGTTAGNLGGNLLFNTKSDGGSLAERMRLDSSGRLGLGTSSPGALLDVAGTARVGTKNSNSLEFYIGGSWSLNDYYSIAWSNQYQTSSEIRGIQTDTPGSSRASALAFFTTNGANNVMSERLRIDSLGRVGIGTTAPSVTLHTQGTIRASRSNGESKYLDIYHSGGEGFIDSVNGDVSTVAPIVFRTGNSSSTSEKARLTGDGKLLVGTSSARSNFYNSSDDSVIQLEGVTNPSSCISVVQNYNTNTNGPSLVFGKNNSQTKGTNVLVASGDTLGRVSFQGNDGTEFVAAADISAVVDGTPGANDMPGRLVFSTTKDGQSSPTEAFRIKNSGAIGSCLGIYNQTTVSAANMLVDSNGDLYRSTSSIKYKINVETLQDQYADTVLQCRPVWYQSITGNDNPDWGFWGFIAEEVAAIDPRLVNWKTYEVTYDEKGSIVQTPCEPEPEGVQYDRFVPHLLNLIKRQKEQIEAMEARLSALEAK